MALFGERIARHPLFLDVVSRVLGQRRAPAALLACIGGLDLTINLVSPPYGVLAFLDEPAHLFTAAIALAAGARIKQLSGPFVITALAASVLIDVDHVPQVLGWQFLTSGTPRPYSHSLLTVVVFAMTSALTPARRPELRAALAGVFVGVGLHLWRDLGTGQVSLLWPVTKKALQLPYLLYFGSLAALAVWCWLSTKPGTSLATERAGRP